MYKYNYVVFNNYDDNKIKPQKDGYNTICLSELENLDDITVVSYPCDHLPILGRILFYLLGVYHKKTKWLPFKDKWFPFYFKNKFKRRKPICFIFIAGYNTPASYLEYVKKTYTGCKAVVFYRDLIKFAAQNNPKMVNNPLLDLQMTYDEGESKKYGIPVCSEYGSIIDLPNRDKYTKCDVFLAATAKDRLDRIMKAYHILTDYGLKCEFYLFKVPDDKKEDLPGIKYIDRYMPYKESLYRTVNAKCILDINQRGANGGLTSRFIEAVQYNKKIITDNTYMRDSKFYNSRDMLIIEDPEDITSEFLDNLGENVDYHYNGEFSPLRMIERVESLLNN